MKKFYSLAAFVLGSSFWLLSHPALTAAAEAPSGREIIEKMLAAYYYPRQDARMEISMRIVNRQGQVRSRRLVMLRRDEKDQGDQFYYIYFHEPADIQGMSFLVWKHPGREDDRWLYLPSLDLVKRISTRDKRTSFAGSDFTYEDVSGRHIDEDLHAFVGEEPIGERSAWVVKSVPQRPGEVEFKYRKIWIDKTTGLPLKVEHYNHQDKIFKVYEAQEIPTLDGTPTITKAIMKDLENERFTEITVAGASYNVGLEADLFQERTLRRPPSQWIR